MFLFLQQKFYIVCAQLRYLPQALALIWAAARAWTLVWAGLLLLQGLLPIAIVYLTRTVVDSIVGAIGAEGDWQVVRSALLWVALLAGLMALMEVLRSVTGWVRAVQAELVQDHLSGVIHAKAMALDLAAFETPAYYDRLYQASVDAFHRPVALLETLGSLVQHSLTFIAMAGVLGAFGWWVPLLLMSSTAPALVVVLRYTVRQNQWRLRTTTDRRRVDYFDWLLTVRETAAELRLFALGQVFEAAFQNLRQRLRREHIQLIGKQALAELMTGALALLTTGAVSVWMVWRAAQGEVSLGDVTMFYQAFGQGQGLMRVMLGNVSQLYSNVLFLENLFAFLQLPSKIVDPPQPQPVPDGLREGIALRDVSFRYPSSERLALDRFSLTIPAGRTVAVVGANGAGKSTLVKLLCRFYDPEAGSITFDGIDIRQVALDALRRQITVLFQQPVQYHMTASENIALSDLDAEPDATAIANAARAAGADGPIARLSEGYETVLGRWFGGAELSVGEWQRVALARAFLRQSPILVLDEPTSAMDSWAEAAWMERFRTLAQGKTVVIITHRFTTAMQADIIHVMEAGQVVESGTHRGLVACGGRYAQSWAMQMQAHDDRLASEG